MDAWMQCVVKEAFNPSRDPTRLVLFKVRHARLEDGWSVPITFEKGVHRRKSRAQIRHPDERTRPAFFL